MKLRGLVVLCVAASIAAALALASTPALAQDASLKRAQDAYDKGVAAYQAQRWDEAIDQWNVAYEARPFAQFLYNIGGAYQMKGRGQNDVAALEKAIEFYQRYVKEEPGIRDTDKKEVASLTDGIRKAIDELKANPPAPGATAPPVVVESLGEAKIRGLVVIESDPPNANIYLDTKKTAPLGKTPWSGSIDGEHTVFVERQGYKPMEKQLSPDPAKLMVIYFGMSEEDYLGWLEIKSNIPGADVYFDDKSVGVAAKTPYSGNVKPGKKKVWVTAEGYDEYYAEIEIIPGKTHEITATLKGSPVGYVNLRGQGIEFSTVYLDGKVLCERGPCRKAVAQGTHTVSVRRDGHKPYTGRIDVQPKTEVTVRAQLAKKPGHADAITAYVFSGVFLGAGIYLGLQSSSIKDDLDSEIDAGRPPPDPNDSRFQRGKIFAIAADSAFALSAVSALTAIYYTFRDKGPPSSGTVDVRAVALEPQVGPGYAGVGMEVHW